jgi:hypothetical protein
MRQSEARDLRSFLAEPVEEIVVEGAKGTEAHLQEVGVQFISGAETQLHGTGARFATPWEGTGGELHEVGARFTSPWEAMLWGTTCTETPAPGAFPALPDMLASDQFDKDDLTLQQTMPIPRIAELSGAQSGLSPLRPYRLQRYQSRGVPVLPSRSASGALKLRPAGNKEPRTTADLAPAPQKIVPDTSSPALRSWERRRHAIYTWLVLFTLFLLVVLGGIGLDSLLASYR